MVVIAEGPGRRLENLVCACVLSVVCWLTWHCCCPRCPQRLSDSKATKLLWNRRVVIRGLLRLRLHGLCTVTHGIIIIQVCNHIPGVWWHWNIYRSLKTYRELNPHCRQNLLNKAAVH